MVVGSIPTLTGIAGKFVESLSKAIFMTSVLVAGGVATAPLPIPSIAKFLLWYPLGALSLALACKIKSAFGINFMLSFMIAPVTIAIFFYIVTRIFPIKKEKIKSIRKRVDSIEDRLERLERILVKQGILRCPSPEDVGKIIAKRYKGAKFKEKEEEYYIYEAPVLGGVGSRKIVVDPITVSVVEEKVSGPFLLEIFWKHRVLVVILIILAAIYLGIKTIANPPLSPEEFTIEMNIPLVSEVVATYTYENIMLTALEEGTIVEIDGRSLTTGIPAERLSDVLKEANVVRISYKNYEVVVNKGEDKILLIKEGEVVAEYRLSDYISVESAPKEENPECISICSKIAEAAAEAVSSGEARMELANLLVEYKTKGCTVPCYFDMGGKRCRYGPGEDGRYELRCGGETILEV